jgi:hypothetical protein
MQDATGFGSVGFMRSTGLVVGPLACALVLIGALAAGSATAQTVDHQAADSPADQPDDQPDFSMLADPPEVVLRASPSGPGSSAALAPIGSRNEKADGSVAVTAGHRLPTAWDAKVGVDVAAPATVPDAFAGQANRGAGWANLAVPAETIGLDKATIDARVDPNADQGQLSTSLSHSVPIGGGGMSITMQNGYAVTQSLANPSGALPSASAPGTAPTRVYSGDGGVRVELPSATAFSAGATMSSTDERLLPRVSAEQKLFGTPLSITGSISERPTGDTDRSIRAGFKRTW